ncbi:MAG: sulfurtransferase [Micrococcaceae bacterium]
MSSASGRRRSEPPAVLIDADTLAGWLGVGASTGTEGPGFVSAEAVPARGHLVILDVRWSAQAPGQGHEQYRQGHIPGAVFVSMSGQLSGHGAPTLGRHPLPDPVRFTDSVRMLGINDGDTVVVYDDVFSAAAPRAWWLLRHAGFDKVYVLDGGLAAWRDRDLPQQAGEVLPVVGDAHTSWGKMPVVDTDEIEAIVEAGAVMDARAVERYRGEIEPLDPVAGHIPGAISVPLGELMTPEGRFRPADQLREHFAGLDVDESTPVVSYCGSGVTAAAEVLALNLAGIEAALYPGSWSAWCNTSGRAVAAGDAGDADAAGTAMEASGVDRV